MYESEVLTAVLSLGTWSAESPSNRKRQTRWAVDELHHQRALIFDNATSSRASLYGVSFRTSPQSQLVRPREVRDDR